MKPIQFIYTRQDCTTNEVVVPPLCNTWFVKEVQTLNFTAPAAPGGVIIAGAGNWLSSWSTPTVTSSYYISASNTGPWKPIYVDGIPADGPGVYNNDYMPPTLPNCVAPQTLASNGTCVDPPTPPTPPTPPLGGSPPLVCTPTNQPNSIGLFYYVGGTNANDANNGTSPSTPWATIGRVNGFNFPAGSTIIQQANLSGNLIFDGAINAAAATPLNPITYDGNGYTLVSSNSGDGSIAVLLNNVNGVVFENTTVRANDELSDRGIDVEGTTTAWVNNNDVGGFTLQEVGRGMDINIQSSGNVTVSNNLVHGLDGVNSNDDFGINSSWSSGLIVISNNTVYNIGGYPNAAPGYSGDAIGAGNSLGGSYLITNNLVHDIGANTNTCGGPSGILIYNADSVTISYNEVYNVQQVGQSGGCDWDGIDLDNGVTNSIVEYNYTHNNEGMGIGGEMGDVGSRQWGPNVYRYNISENDTFGFDATNWFGSMSWGNNGDANPIIYVYGNTIYQNAKSTSSYGHAAMDFIGSPAKGSIVVDNLLVVGNGNYDYGCINGGPNFSNIKFANNGYYALSGNAVATFGSCATSGSLANWEAISQETGSVTGNADFAGSVPAGAISWNPAETSGPLPGPLAYLVTGNSPYLGKGIDPAAAGAPSPISTTDYFGDTIVSYGIGAYQGGTPPTPNSSSTTPTTTIVTCAVESPPASTPTPPSSPTPTAQTIYVNDGTGNRVEAFTTTGQYLFQFGSTGSGPDQFGFLYGLRQLQNGLLVVTDATNNRVTTWTTSGNYVGEIGSPGPGFGQFGTPDMAAEAPSGNIWVSDVGAGQMNVFTSSYEPLLQTQGFNGPTGVAFDNAGNTWILNTRSGQVMELNASGNPVFQFGSLGSGNGQLSDTAWSLAFDSQNRIWVADTGNNRIEVFDTSGNYLFQFGSWGTGPGEMWNPLDLAFDANGNVWVTDQVNDRVQEFDSNGNYLFQFGTEGSGNGQFTFPIGITIINGTP
jgi:hypothetical protein